VRGRPVNPSYRYGQVSLEPGSTLEPVNDTGATIYAETIVFADTQVNEVMGCSWEIHTEQYADTVIKLGRIGSRGRMRSNNSIGLNIASTDGSLIARMRSRGVFRTGQ